MQSLQRDPTEARVLLENIRVKQEEMGDASGTGDLEFINFDDFLKMMESVENKLAKEDPHNLGR